MSFYVTLLQTDNGSWFCLFFAYKQFWNVSVEQLLAVMQKKTIFLVLPIIAEQKNALLYMYQESWDARGNNLSIAIFYPPSIISIWIHDVV